MLPRPPTTSTPAGSANAQVEVEGATYASPGERRAPGDAGVERADGEGRDLVAGEVDAHGLGCHLAVAHRHRAPRAGS